MKTSALISYGLSIAAVLGVAALGYNWASADSERTSNENGRSTPVSACCAGAKVAATSPGCSAGGCSDAKFTSAETALTGCCPNTVNASLASDASCPAGGCGKLASGETSGCCGNSAAISLISDSKAACCAGDGAKAKLTSASQGGGCCSKDAKACSASDKAACSAGECSAVKLTSAKEGGCCSKAVDASLTSTEAACCPASKAAQAKLTSTDAGDKPCCQMATSIAADSGCCSKVAEAKLVSDKGGECSKESADCPAASGKSACSKTDAKPVKLAADGEKEDSEG